MITDSGRRIAADILDLVGEGAAALIISSVSAVHMPVARGHHDRACLSEAGGDGTPGEDHGSELDGPSERWSR
ncbi:hypothetical protein GCM10023200_05270 [Actinomycetospora chlora]|uniref:Uncharacterized protein n=1 Tax=Actinomycetospora chlora TaxID=663608 RepID=A0ABP9A8M0_9PSEU